MRQGVRQGCPLSPILFNLFVEALAERLRTSGFGTKVKGIDLESLLYADDVVLIGDSITDLQGMIDVVDKFCRQWRMEINLKKSEVMVVGKDRRCVCAIRKTRQHLEVDTNDTVPVAECVLCSPWVCRGKRLKVVHKYKYLGIWLTSDLSWDTHIGVKLDQAAKRTKALAKVFSNRQLSARAKTLVWLGSVRPLLEYGCEVWKADETQLAKLESVQLTAGKKIFKLSSRTSSAAVRGLMAVPELRIRHAKLRLNYMAKVKGMDKGRLARTVIFLKPDEPAAPALGKVRHWWTVADEFVAKDRDLSAAFGKLQRAAARNQGVVPSGMDPTLTDYEYFPIKSWRRTVRWWAQAAEKRAFLKRQESSTLELMRRALSAGESHMPRFTLTRRACWGPDMIRFRLLAGMSGLNATMSKVDEERSPACPFVSCASTKEDTVHFLLHCKELDGLRKDFLNRLHDRCTCDRRLGSGGEVGCSEFYHELNDAGKALFMLGGPVDGRSPEGSIDACAREFVRKAWRVRCSTLEEQAEVPLVTDLTGGTGKGGQATIDSFFGPRATTCTGRVVTPEDGKLNSCRPKHARTTRTRTRSSTRARSSTRTAQSAIGYDGRIVLANGSGLYDSTHVMRSD
jgi:hypothetical protein